VWALTISLVCALVSSLGLPFDFHLAALETPNGRAALDQVK
jgi:hypothetical protein